MSRLLDVYDVDKEVSTRYTAEINEKIKKLLHGSDKYQINYYFDEDRDTIYAKFFRGDKVLGDEFDIIKLNEFKNSFVGIKQSKMYIIDDEKVFPDLNIDILANNFVNIFLSDIYNGNKTNTPIQLSVLITENVKKFDKYNELEDWCLERLWKLLDKRHVIRCKIIEFCKELVKEELESDKNFTRVLIIHYLSNGNCEADGDRFSIPNMYCKLVEELIPFIFEETKQDDKWYNNIEDRKIRREVKLF